MTPTAISFRHLDVLRGALAIYVLIGHGRWLLWQGHAAWQASPHQPWEMAPAYVSAVFRYGREAVMVFFVLSGFFIHYQAAATQRPRSVSIVEFYRRRWHRLAGPYFFALGVTVVCDGIGRHWWPTLYGSRTGDALLDATLARTGFTPEAVVPALFLLPSALGRDFGSNGPLWSLAYEVVYYAAYPFWLLLRQRSGWLAFVVLPVTCLMLVFAPVSGFPVAVAAHYPIWLAGAWLAERVRARGIGRALLLSAAVAFTVGAALRLMFNAPVLTVIAAMLYGTGAVIMFGAWHRPNLLSSIGEFLGLRSYTIYIVHFPILALIAAAAIHSYGGRPLHGWLAASGVIATVAAACVCFEICERRFLHLRYRDDSAAP